MWKCQLFSTIIHKFCKVVGIGRTKQKKKIEIVFTCDKKKAKPLYSAMSDRKYSVSVVEIVFQKKYRCKQVNSY